MFPNLSTASKEVVFSVVQAVNASTQNYYEQVDISRATGLNFKTTYFQELIQNYYHDLVNTSPATLANQAREQASIIYSQFDPLLDEFYQFIYTSGDREAAQKAGIDYVNYDEVAAAAGYVDIINEETLEF
jgi:hypothetical protein